MSVSSGQHRETKESKKHEGLSRAAWLARWTTLKGMQGIEHRRKRPRQESSGTRRNLLLLIKTFSNNERDDGKCSRRLGVSGGIYLLQLP